MQTRCPACQTLYRIDEDVLKRAGGQARCFRCDTVFDAYQHPAEDADPDHANHLPDIDEDGAASSDSAPLSELSALDELPDVPSHSGLDPDSELNLDDLADRLRELDSTLSEQTPPEPPGSKDASDDPALAPLPPLDNLDELPDLQIDEPQTEDQPFAAAPQPSRLPALLKGAAAVLLVLLAVAQLGWFKREQVLATPIGQGLAQALCSLFDCQLPPRRAASRYAVIERNIGADPEQAGVLLMHLSFRNGADFAQPLPDIQLSFYDTEQQLMARRRLHPDEYLFPAPPPGMLAAPQDVIQVELRLEDPGRHASGFKLEFL
jgi:predicted Zn finger-like uncharacterized protein